MKRERNSFRIVSVLSLGLIVGAFGCSDDSSTSGGTPDTAPPKIISVAAVDGQDHEPVAARYGHVVMRAGSA